MLASNKSRDSMRSPVVLPQLFYTLRCGSMLYDHFQIRDRISDKKIIHLCLFMLQKQDTAAYCGLMDCTGNIVETCFSFCRLLES